MIFSYSVRFLTPTTTRFQPIVPKDWTRLARALFSPKDIDGYLTDKNVQNILAQILSDYQISQDRVCLNCLKPLKCKLDRLWKALKGQKGSEVDNS